MRPPYYLVLLAVAVGCESPPQLTQPRETSANLTTPQYTITKLSSSLGGTVNRGTAINNQGLVAGFSNLARFALPDYDRAFEKARALPDSPERTRELRRMSELLSLYAPWVLLAYRYENVLVQPWLIGYKYNPTYQYPFPYLDIDLSRRAATK